MKKIVILLVGVIYSLTTYGQQHPVEVIYEEQKAIDSLKKYDQAATLIYQRLKKNCQKKDIIQKAIWHSYLADFLKNYYSFEQYSIIGRSPIAGTNVDSLDFEQWDLQTLIGQTIYHYNQSVENEAVLMNESAKDYFKLFEDIDSSDQEYYNSLYDILAALALDFYSTTISVVPLPELSFSIENKDYLADNNLFLKTALPAHDSLSFNYQVLKLFQQATAQHIKNNQTNKLIQLTLERLDFVYQRINIDNKEELLLKQLHLLEQEYLHQDGYEHICFYLGKTYINRGTHYDARGDTLYRTDYQTAYSWLKKAEKSSNADLHRLAAEAIDNLNDTVISIRTEVTHQSNRPIFMVFNTLHVDSLNIYIYRFSSYQQLQSFPYNQWNGAENFSQKIKDLTKNNPIVHCRIEGNNLHNFRNNHIEFIADPLPYGHYIVLVSPLNKPIEQLKEEEVSCCSFTVSDITLKSRSNGGTTELFAFNSIDGKAMGNIKGKAQYTCNGKSETTVFNFDEKGKAFLGTKNKFCSVQVQVRKGDDEQVGTFNSYPTYSNSVSDINRAYTFLDRLIYRPGQEVYFKSILVHVSTQKQEVLPNATCTVTLYDANGEKIASKILVSNEFGSISGSFTLPSSGLTGSFHINVVSRNKEKNIYGNKDFLVEEYKRPTFEVVMEQPEACFKLDEALTVKGNVNAYAGYPIDGANIHYRVVRKESYPFYRYSWLPWRAGQDKEITNGNCQSDSNGCFKITFIAESIAQNKAYFPLYQYFVYVDVTDISGETQSQNIVVAVGEKNLFFHIDMSEEIDKDSTYRFLLTTTNLAGKIQESKVHYRIEKLASPSHFLSSKAFLPQGEDSYFIDSILFKKYFPDKAFKEESEALSWAVVGLQVSGEINTSAESMLDLPHLNKWEEGYYKIHLQSKDAFGEEVSYEKIVYVRDKKNKKCSKYVALELSTDRTTAKSRDTIEVEIQSYLHQAPVFLEIISDGRVVERKELVLNQEKKRFNIVLDSNYKENVHFWATTLQNGQFYAAKKSIAIVDTLKILDMTFATFRDNLLPGEEEKWEITLKGKQGELLVGELLCSMYDASLDAFCANSYRLSIPRLSSSKTMTYQFSSLFHRQGSLSHSHNIGVPTYRIGTPLWAIDNYLYRASRYYSTRLAGAKGVMVNAQMEMATVSDNAILEKSGSATEDETDETEETVDASEEPVQTDIQVRSNFEETAFFYPHLRTDEKGNIVFSTTMPESLTKWKMLGLAHSKDLYVGQFEKTIQTKKDLMVVPNCPRFFRQGDTLYFTAKVVNLSSNNLSGNATITFYDAVTMQEIDIVKGQRTVNFTTSIGQTGTVSYQIVIPGNLSAISYKIIATAGKYSDGEQKTVAVLTNRMLVTQSMPVYVNGNEGKTFLFKDLKESFLQENSTLSHHKFTFEFTANPSWYALQSLPYLIDYPHQCNEQLFSRMYANLVGEKILNSSPKIKEVLKAWEQDSVNTFRSALEKNEELKSVVLSQTPWVTDAKEEKANKKNLALLFNSSKIDKEITTISRQLASYQMADGGWSWFKGGRNSNFFITNCIVTGSGHLQTMGIERGLSSSVLKKAIHYLDNEAAEIYTQLQKQKSLNNMLPSCSLLFYLYGRSFFLNEEPIGTKHKEMYTYWLNNCKKEWKTRSFFEQTMIALILYRNNQTSLAKEIVSYLKSMAQYSDQMGMWWKKEGLSPYWYQAPIERQALMIEAFNLIAEDQESVGKMQLWLLRQKQTQSWSSTQSTTRACYALLLGGESRPLEEEQAVHLEIGTFVFDTDTMKNAEAGSGYFKTSWSEDEIKESMATIRIKNKRNSTAFGAAYWQYFEDLDKIKAAQTSLQIEKDLFLVKNGSKGEVLVKINDHHRIHVGDKVRVRILIKSDRDLEYVHLKDMRAATFEPVSVFSGYHYQDKLIYYEAPGDAATNFFIEYLPKGTFVFEYSLIATQKGCFSNGTASIQCMYAPEFTSQSKGIRIEVEK